MLGGLAHAEIVFGIVAVIAVVVAIGIMAVIMKTKKPAELPESMQRGKTKETQ